MCSVLKCLLACLIPPLAVLIEEGCSGNCCVNLLLTLFCYVPGCIHAYCIICGQKPQHYGGNQTVVCNPQVIVNQPGFPYPQPNPTIPYPQPMHIPMGQPSGPYISGSYPHPMSGGYMSGPPPDYCKATAPELSMA